MGESENQGNESCNQTRRRPSSPRKRHGLVVAAIAVVALVAVIPVRICHDRTFLCENTGSHKGYRQWCVGLQSGKWHRESLVFMWL